MEDMYRTDRCADTSQPLVDVVAATPVLPHARTAPYPAAVWQGPCSMRRFPFLLLLRNNESKKVCRRRPHSNNNHGALVLAAAFVNLALLAFLWTAVPCCRGFAFTVTTAPPYHGRVHRPAALTSRATRRGTPFAAMSKPPKGDDDDAKAVESSSSAATTTTTTASWLLSLCLPLWLVYITNQWSRFSINSLVDFSSSSTAYAAMNVDLNFDQAQYGVLASVAFTSLFALASVAAGYLTDKVGDRKRVTYLSALAWSVATFGMSQSSSYAQVVACRVATGLACAFSTPAAYTLLQEKVPSNQQALASSVYGTGVAVASALSALSIVLDNQFGWRNTLVAVSAAGFAASAASALLLPPDDPKKTDSVAAIANAEDKQATTTATPFWEEVKDVLTSNPRVQWIYLASLIRFGCGLTIGIWGAPYFRLAYPDAQNLFAAYLATISAVGATVSGIAGGAAADKLSQPKSDNDDNRVTIPDDDLIGRRLWVPVVGSVLAAPAWYLAVQSHQDFSTSMGFLALEYLVAECWFGPTISTLQASVRPGTGGTAQGIFTLTGAVGNLAPSVIGFLYASSQAGGASLDASGVDDLSGLLAISVGVGYLASAVCFAAASRASAALSLSAADRKAKQS